MHEEPHRHGKSSGPGSSGNIGLLLGAVGLAAGATYCLRNHFGNSSGLLPDNPSRLMPKRNSSGLDPNQRNWLLGALGAALAGVAVSTAVAKKNHKGGKMDARGKSGDVKLSSHVTINRSPEEIYQFWRDFQNLPRVMSFIERVEPREGNITHWVAKGPAGPAVEWDSEVVDDNPGKLLAWRSLEGSDLQTWGTVMFKPREGNRGTEVSVAFNFCPPPNATGALSKFMTGLENAVLDKNLKNLKAQLEAGEIASSRRYTTGRESAGKGQPS